MQTRPRYEIPQWVPIKQLAPTVVLRRRTDAILDPQFAPSPLGSHCGSTGHQRRDDNGNGDGGDDLQTSDDPESDSNTATTSVISPTSAVLAPTSSHAAHATATSIGGGQKVPTWSGSYMCSTYQLCTKSSGKYCWDYALSLADRPIGAKDLCVDCTRLLINDYNALRANETSFPHRVQRYMYNLAKSTKSICGSSFVDVGPIVSSSVLSPTASAGAGTNPGTGSSGAPGGSTNTNTNATAKQGSAGFVANAQWPLAVFCLALSVAALTQ
ncbi:uncharacterized protein BJ171DRAFT_515147 [Polychytrium aggregatum]|uniref:uncharacterized protein n=1 Tax=Polychytrium aggregatum TaxID=110093 RepID=UPI0022FF36C6|nr:uncharacterized protein BJ171DRAFT_515147 [Polychytrium aggregatum]KAI9202185.1 hypothetical protein BJ171DRAFT_515147 [Polychytrium aggregatum]